MILEKNIIEDCETYCNFNWIEYKNNYEDLTHFSSKKEAWSHWIHYGKKENRFFFKNMSDKFQCEEDIENNIEDEYQYEVDNDYLNNIIEDDIVIKSNFEDDIIEDDIVIKSNTDDNDELSKIKKKFYELLDIKKNFDWLQYTQNNEDLNFIMDKRHAWYHWVVHGSQEKRNIEKIDNNYNINTTISHSGRFGNLFFVNMVVHLISKKYDLNIEYKYYDKFKNLGIELYIGKNTYKKNIYLTELNYFDLINKKDDFTNIIINNNSWFHHYDFCLFLQIYFNKEKIKNNIIKNNKFKERYNNNNDIFIHVRLDDIENTLYNNNYEYYDNIINKYTFDNGYITSDNIKSNICVKLINKYSLKVIDLNEEETIMFGSTCNTIILSGGTFSWLIGFLAYYSKSINYPIQKKKWYGNIFFFEKWIGHN